MVVNPTQRSNPIVNSGTNPNNKFKAAQRLLKKVFGVLSGGNTTVEVAGKREEGVPREPVAPMSGRGALYENGTHKVLSGVLNKSLSGQYDSPVDVLEDLFTLGNEAFSTLQGIDNSVLSELPDDVQQAIVAFKELPEDLALALKKEIKESGYVELFDADFKENFKSFFLKVQNPVLKSFLEKTFSDFSFHVIYPDSDAHNSNGVLHLDNASGSSNVDDLPNDSDVSTQFNEALTLKGGKKKAALKKLMKNSLKNQINNPKDTSYFEFMKLAMTHFSSDKSMMKAVLKNFVDIVNTHPAGSSDVVPSNYYADILTDMTNEASKNNDGVLGRLIKDAFDGKTELLGKLGTDENGNPFDLIVRGFIRKFSKNESRAPNKTGSNKKSESKGSLSRKLSGDEKKTLNRLKKSYNKRAAMNLEQKKNFAVQMGGFLKSLPPDLRVKHLDAAKKVFESLGEFQGVKEGFDINNEASECVLIFDNSEISISKEELMDLKGLPGMYKVVAEVFSSGMPTECPVLEKPVSREGFAGPDDDELSSLDDAGIQKKYDKQKMKYDSVVNEFFQVTYGGDSDVYKQNNRYIENIDTLLRGDYSEDVKENLQYIKDALVEMNSELKKAKNEDGTLDMTHYFKAAKVQMRLMAFSTSPDYAANSAVYDAAFARDSLNQNMSRVVAERPGRIPLMMKELSKVLSPESKSYESVQSLQEMAGAVGHAYNSLY